MVLAANVYEGFWTNWDKGRILGGRITLSSSRGTILVAFIAIFVTICGGQMWTIIRFTLQWRVGKGEGDEIDAERKLISQTSAWTTLVASLKTIYDRQRRGPSLRSTLRRFAPAMILAVVSLAGWILAGGFSSKITQALDDHILIRSRNCGFYTDTSVSNSFTPAAGFEARSQNRTRRAYEYAQTCYNTIKSSNGLCRRFVQQEIKWTANATASCPFVPGMCLGGDTGAFEMDTGMVESHRDLGFNTVPKNRVLYRRKTTCAPLVTRKPYAELIPGKFLGEEYSRYYYGDIANSTNITYQISTYAQTGQTGYLLTYVYSSHWICS